MLHAQLYFLFVLVFPRMEAPNFIFECISVGGGGGVNTVFALVLDNGKLKRYLWQDGSML